MNINGMGFGMGSSSPPPPPPTNAKKKRRTNPNSAAAKREAAAAAAALQAMQNREAAAIQAMQNFGPNPMKQEQKDFAPAQCQEQHIPGFNDNLIASNPFDDAPQRRMNFGVQNGPPQMQQQHPNFMGNPQLRGMNPMQVGNTNMMQGMPRMGNPAMGPMNPMGQSTNRPSMVNVNPMSGMGPNLSPGPMGTMNSPLNMNVNINMTLTNPQMSGPPITGSQMAGFPLNSSIMGGPAINRPGMNISPMNCLPMGGPSITGSSMDNPMSGLINNSRASPGANMNQGIGNSMSGSMGSPLNPMSPNQMSNEALNVAAMNALNRELAQSLPQSQLNPMNNIRAPRQRPPNRSMPGMNSAVPGSAMVPNPMNPMHLNTIRPQLNNMNNGNPRHQAPMGNLISNLQNNMPGKFPGQGMNVGNSSMLQQRLQGQPPQGAKPSMQGPMEKIFPPDQPMIFNHQNPNAPLISPCGACHKEVNANEQAIFCESGCNFWFHRRCTELTDWAYEMLMAEPYAEWVCNKCWYNKNPPPVKFKS